MKFLTDSRTDVVLDPFAGSNMTGWVADQNGRRWISFEIDETYPQALSIPLDLVHEGGRFIHPRTKAEVSPQAHHSQADVILRRLETWGFLDIQARRRRVLLSTTEMGAGASACSVTCSSLRRVHLS